MHMVITVLILIIIMLTSCIFAYKERVEADEIHYEFICKKYKYEIEELKKDFDYILVDCPAGTQRGVSLDFFCGLF